MGIKAQGPGKRVTGQVAIPTNLHLASGLQ